MGPNNVPLSYSSMYVYVVRQRVRGKTRELFFYYLASTPLAFGFHIAYLEEFNIFDKYAYILSSRESNEMCMLVAAVQALSENTFYKLAHFK